jgi:solute carrier family 25 carnitine/acylcarnitine transporter 20/29
MSTNAKPQQTSGLVSFLTGGFGGVCLVAVGHPMDLIKVNIQTMEKPKPGQPPMYTGAIDCARKIVAKDGFGGLYRGMSAPLVGVTPIFAVCFWGNDMGKLIARKAMSTPDHQQLSMGQLMFAGGFSAIPATVVMAPGERIKCLLQIQAQAVSRGEPALYDGMVDCAKKLYKTGGISSIFRGWEATLLRDVPGSVGYFGGFEAIKRALTPKDSEASAFRVFLAGGFAGMINWTIAIPADVIKSRIQTAPEGTYRGIVHCYQVMMKEEGAGALFKGMAPALARAFPANAACFLGVEFSKKFLASFGFY